MSAGIQQYWISQKNDDDDDRREDREYIGNRCLDLQGLLPQSHHHSKEIDWIRGVVLSYGRGV